MCTFKVRPIRYPKRDRKDSLEILRALKRKEVERDILEKLREAEEENNTDE